MSDTNNTREDVSRVQEILSSAISKLDVQHISLSESRTFVKDDFGPSDDEISNYVTQSFVRTAGFASSEDGKQFGFKIAAGIRLIPRGLSEEQLNSEDQDHTCAEIRAAFLALYSADGTVSEEEARLFHEKNVRFQVWPFWREFVTQMGWRMNAPYFQVKMLKNNVVKKLDD